MSRRQFGSALAVALAAGALSGCATDPTGGGAESGAAGDAFPASVRHKFGTTTVASPPKRVVSVGYTEHDTLLALGMIPVGVTDWYGDQPYATWPWAQEKLGDARPTVLTAADGVNFEAVADLTPDLIVGTNAGMTKDDYDKLSEIAPTIAQSGQYTDYFEPWSEQAESIGRAVGKQGEVSALIKSIKDSYADAAKAHPEFAGKKAIFLQNAVSDGSVIAYQDGLSTDFLTRLGFAIPSELDEYADGTSSRQAYIPIEQLTVLNSADILIWGTEKDSDRTALEEVPGFTALAPVQAGRSVYTGGVLAGAIYFTSPLSLPHVLTTLTPLLATALAV